MKIFHLIPALSGGGAERQLSYLAPALVRRGHEVHIAYLSEGPQKPVLPSVVLHQLKSRSNHNPFLLWQLFQLIRRIKPDIIHTWLMQMDILGGMTAMLNRVPWIFRESSSAMAYPLTWKYCLRVLVGSGAKAIVANSQGGKEYWKEQLPRKCSYVITNGLPAQEIDNIPAALPVGLNLPQAPIVLYVGRLSSDITATKNLKSFLEILACVKREQKVVGILCGKGPQREELENLGRNLGLEADLHFIGHLPAVSVWALMKKASLFVSLSAYEGCPNAVMEAMACGCPLVLSDIPAHRMLINDECALFVDPSDIQKTANTIIGALRETDVSQSRSLLAKQKAQEWSITEMAKNWERVYQECV